MGVDIRMDNAEKMNDDVLYGCYLNGKKEAFDQFMIRYGDSLTRYLYRYLNDWQDAEDLMIEAMARIMAKKPRISEGCFRAYLYKTGRNLATRFHFKRTRISQFSLDEYEEIIGDHTPLETKALEEERKQILHRCLERIDPKMKEALWLVYYEGMTYAEAGTVMGLSTKRVDHLLDRGKKKMRQELEKEGLTNAYE